MRIGHADLENCLRNPKQWYASSLIKPEHGFSMGYARALALTIFHFHKTDDRDARRYLKEMVKKHRFKDASRVTQIESGLESYIKWALEQKLRVAGTQINISLELGFLELRGQLARVDVTKSGYRAVLFGQAPPEWQAQLRMPLIQLAVSTLYARPLDRMEVGFQNLDGRNLQTLVFEHPQVAAAELKFRALGQAIQRLARKNKPPS